MYTEFHTWKEILQQPDMWLKTFEIVKNRKDEISAFIKKYVEAGYEIVLTGAGTSAYIGDALQWALSGTLLHGAKAVATTALTAVLNAAGSSPALAVKTTCFLADIKDFAVFNEVYGNTFTGKPARSCVAVKDLPKGALVEVEVIAELA